MKKIVSTDKYPATIGAYSQGVEKNGILYTSGQIPIDPLTGKLITGDFSKQVQIVLSNLRIIIEEGGFTVDNIVKTTVFLKDLDNFKTVNEAYKEFFKNDFPARSAVEVSKLPLNADIEIEAVCIK
ncbi:MAG: hypothetical protein CBD58_03935 [bacterium TMED198]|nr:MAG: hypothetical protein CBD58_03935 [bacterium TMED198]|tara:strand:- start:284 stop:661 length:378 start_codon:yes stop_codon:yes gene_type:complete